MLNLIRNQKGSLKVTMRHINTYLNGKFLKLTNIKYTQGCGTTGLSHTNSESINWYNHSSKQFGIT